MIALEVPAARLHLKSGVVLQHDFQFVIAAVELYVLRRESQHVNVFRLRGNQLQSAAKSLLSWKNAPPVSSANSSMHVHIGESGLVLILHLDVVGGHARDR